MSDSSPFLLIDHLDVHYGGIHALRDVSLYVNRGEIVSVIGANGAGKSTLLNAISGVVARSAGMVSLEGQELPKHADEVVTTGITLVPEGRRIFAPLSVRENLMLGAYTRRDHEEREQNLELVFRLFPILKERIDQLGGTLSGGEQQMLAVGRALMTNPRVLLLDEPSLGLAPLIIQDLFKTIVQLNKEQGLTVLLVEQNASMALRLSHRAYVLRTGEIIMSGKGTDLLNDPRVRESYLGVAR